MTARRIEQETAPDVRDLRAFCLVVDLGSVTAAAEALHETKGSVSRRLSRLEEGMGVRLLRRSPRLVQPTEEGADYRARVGRALELLDDAGAQLRGARDAPRGTLRVTAPNDIAVSMLAPLVARFVERYPDVRVDMLLTERRLDFEAEHVDVAFRASAALEDSSLVAHRVCELGGGLFASRAYLRKHGTPAAPEDLASYRLLLMGPVRAGTTLPLGRRGEAVQTPVRIRTAMAAPDASFVREVAAAGGGIAVLPWTIAERDVAQGRLVPVLGDRMCFEATLYLVHQGTRLLTPKVRAFRDHALAELSALRPSPTRRSPK